MPNLRKARDCEICSANYRPSYPGQRACGRACGWQLRVLEGKVAWRAPAPPAVPTPRACAQCHGEYTGRRLKYCSEECARTAWRTADLARHGRTPAEVDHCACGAPLSLRRYRCDACVAATARDARRRAKARRRQVIHEPYTMAEIAQRDDYLCGLCGRMVPMDLWVPDPDAPTIDHILPIARGGQDTVANVQLAHFMCNSIKSDSTPHLVAS